MYRQHHFAANLQRALHQHIQCASDCAFAGIFHRHHAVMHRAAFDRMKHIINVCTRLALHRAAKPLEHGCLAECTLRPEISHRQGSFQRAALRHDLGEQLRHRLLAQRPVIVFLRAPHHLRLALRAQHRFVVFQMPDLLSERRALIEQAEQLVIKTIYLFAVLV